MSSGDTGSAIEIFSTRGMVGGAAGGCSAPALYSSSKSLTYHQHQQENSIVFLKDSPQKECYSVFRVDF